MYFQLLEHLEPLQIWVISCLDPRPGLLETCRHSTNTSGANVKQGGVLPFVIHYVLYPFWYNDQLYLYGSIIGFNKLFQSDTMIIWWTEFFCTTATSKQPQLWWKNKAPWNSHETPKWSHCLAQKNAQKSVQFCYLQSLSLRKWNSSGIRRWI